MTDHFERLTKIVADIRVQGHELRVKRFLDINGVEVEVYYLQDTYIRPDATNNRTERGYGRKWHLSSHATETEVVFTVLKAVLTNGEHEIREGFEYQGKRVFQPHTSIHALLDACDVSDARQVPPGLTEFQRGDILG